MRLNDISVRRYAPGDEPGILKLFEEVFGKTRTEAEWNWQYNDNEHGKGWIAVGTMDQSIVGHSGITRMDLNFNGQRVMGGQAGDAMTHPSVRSLRSYPGIRKYADDLAAREGLQAIFSFPNRLSYPGLVRYAGWCKIVNLSYYVRRIGFEKAWGKGPDRVFKFFNGISASSVKVIRKLRYPVSFEIKVSSSLPDDLDGLLRHKRMYEVLAVWKDHPYLKWRYAGHPGAAYLFHTFRRQGKPLALLITRGKGSAVAICDLLHRSNDEVPAIMLLDHIVRYYARSSAQKIEFYGHDAGFFQYVFEACGFRRIPFSPLMFGGRVISHPALERVFFVPDHWTVAYGDTDVI